MRELTHLIAGVATKGDAQRTADIFNPSTGAVQGKVWLGEASDVDAAVKAAQKVQPEWGNTNPQRRARVMFKFK